MVQGHRLFTNIIQNTIIVCGQNDELFNVTEGSTHKYRSYLKSCALDITSAPLIRPYAAMFYT